jgi:aryl-alcohol dehydrogenase-like predicted oxidoreductase
MDYVRLGASGLTVSRIALGMMSYGDPASRRWHLREDEAEPIVRRAVEAGVTFFDTADVYSEGVSEEITGRLLANLFPRRDDYVLATKVYFPTGSGPNDCGLSRKHVLALAWLLAKPAVSAPIVGATKLPHVEDAVTAVDVDLTEDELARLEAPYRPHAVIGHS